jgi:hypothetical protein
MSAQASTESMGFMMSVGFLFVGFNLKFENMIGKVFNFI